MSKLIELGEVLKYEQPTKYIVGNEFYDDSYKTPVLTAGKSFILGYTNETENIYQNYPVIIFDDFTTAIKFVDFPFKVKSSAMKILSCDNQKGDIRFLFYVMQTLKINSEQHQRYWISKYSKIEIPLPPLSQQKAIAEKLDKADALRKKDQELLAKYDELAQSIFIDMFGDPINNSKKWQIKKGREFFKFTSGKFNPTKNLNRSYEFPTYGGNGITGFSKNYLIDFQTIVIGRVGAYCGSIHITQEKSWITDNAIYIKKLSDKYNLLFLYYFLKNYNLNRFADYAGQPKITQKPLDDLELFQVPLSLQTQFAEKIKNIESQKTLLKKQAQQSEDLFQALLQESFQ